MKKIFILILMDLLLCVSLTTAASPSVGLVLGGGGAKGAATIGALRVIENAGLRVDYIAGTSIGAVIGGLYASGFTLDEIEELLAPLKRIDVLDINYIESKLRTMLRKRGCEYIQQTRIPFRCVAVDLEEMKEYVLSEGKLSKAILASMSVPIIHPFVTWGRVGLNDGGLLNNLPVDVVKSMGAEYVIAIDLQQGEDDMMKIPPIGLGRLFNILANWSVNRPDKKKYRENVGLVDIHIHPRLPGYNAASYGRRNFERMKEIGEREAMNFWNKLINIK